MALRIIFVHHGRTLGGATVSVGLLAQQLNTRGLQTAIVLIDPASDVRRQLESYGVEVIDAPMPTVLFQHTTAHWSGIRSPVIIWRQWLVMTGRYSLEPLEKILAAWRPDVVHLNSAVLAGLVSPLRARGFRVVLHVRESPVRGYFGIRLKYLKRTMCRLGRYTIFISEAYRSAWGHGLGSVIYNTVGSDFHVAGAAHVGAVESRRQAARQSHPCVFGFLGGVSEIKGTLLLLQAWRQGRFAARECRLILGGLPCRHDLSRAARLARRVFPAVGLATYWQKCDRLLQQLGKSVEPAYFDSDLRSFFTRIDVLLFPAMRDHFPRPVIEASAFGVPVIGADLPSVAEVIEERRSGLLAATGDIEDWIEKMTFAAAHPERMRELGHAAHELYKRQWQEPGSVDALVKIYSSQP